MVSIGFIILYLLFGVILPIFIVSKSVGDKIHGNLGQKIMLLVIYTGVFLFIVGVMLFIYESGIPSTTSGLCVNTGGWTYSCPVNAFLGGFLLLMLFLSVVIYNYHCKKIIYEIFSYDYKVAKYVVLILYLVFMLFLNVIFILFIAGVFISAHFDLVILNMFKVIVEFLPIVIFPISVCKDFILKKF